MTDWTILDTVVTLCLLLLEALILWLLLKVDR